MKTIKIAKQYTYLSEVPEFHKGLPFDCILDKQVTGCGGTHLALTSEDPYVVSVHSIRMIESKTNQERYSHVLPVTGVTTISDIVEYVNKGGTKILVTYDSVPKVQEALGEKSKDFRLLVDEVHKLIQYMDKFKPSVAIKLLKKSFDFKSVLYMTATPTDPKWLPEPLKGLEYIKLDWENASKPNISHKYVSNNITEGTLASVLDILDTTDNEVYVFYNSKRNASSLVKKILKCKPNLSIKDINILFADTPENTKYFKKAFGSKFDYGYFPDGTNNKRINIISSMGFEGSDFIPNVDESIKPISIIVSDPTSKSMRFDISIDLVQIAGRFRAHPKTGKIEIYPIIYLWNTQKNDYIQSEEECLRILNEEEKDSTEMIEFGKTNSKQNRTLLALAKQQEDRFIIEEDNKVLLHPYGIEVGMSCYTAMHSDSYVLNNVEDGKVKDDSVVVSKLSNLDPDVNTYTLPTIRSEYTKLLGRRPSVIKLMNEFESLLEGIRSEKSEEAYDNYNKFLIDNPDFTEWLESGVTLSNMNTVGRKRSEIDKLSDSNRRLTTLKQDLIKGLNFKVGEVYPKALIKSMLQEYYDSKNLNLKAKATSIKDYYKVRPTKNAKGDNCFRIIKKL